MRENLIPEPQALILCACCKTVIGKTYLKTPSKRICKACQAIKDNSNVSAPDQVKKPNKT